MNEGSQCHFGAVIQGAEHRLPKYGFANADKIKANRLYNSLNLENPLDKYILAKMKVAIKTIDENLAKYK